MKFLKIFGIALASIAGLAVLLVALAVWFVFTPARLTPVVRNMAGKYITCPHTIGEVELTFFSTFPRFGLEVDGIYLLNPMPGAPSDTLLAAPRLTATINIGAWLKNNAVELDEFALSNLRATLFTDTAGNTNYNVFALPRTTDTEKDTSAFRLPFDAIALKKVALSATRLTYIDRSSQTEAHVNGLDALLWLDINKKDGNGTLRVSASDVSFGTNGNAYARQLALSLNAPFRISPDSMMLRLDKATIAVNQFSATLDGSVAMPPNGDLHTDMTFACADWPVKPLLALVPPTYASTLEGIDVDGILAINGKASGVYNDTQMPLIDLHCALRDAHVVYADYPRFHTISGNMDTHINLNDTTTSHARINHLTAKTGRSTFEASGKIDRLLADMLCDITLKMNMFLPDVKPMLPSDMNIGLAGSMSGTANAKFSLPQLRTMAVEQMNINGKMNVINLRVAYDSMLVATNRAQVDFTIPNPATRHKQTRFVAANLAFDRLNYAQGKHLHADLQAPRLRIETSNMLRDKRFLSATFDFAADGLTAQTNDNISGTLTAPSGKAFIQMDRVDTTALPTIHADMKMAHLTGHMDTISADMNQPALTLTLAGMRQDKSKPHIRVKYNCQALKTNMGNYAQAKTEQLRLAATGSYDGTQKNFLLQWEPNLNIDLHQGEVAIASFPEKITIPAIAFNFNNQIFTIDDSRIVLGNSDFSLKGKIENTGAWMRNEGLLKGELDFVSNVTDVNQLMELTSGMGNSDSTQTALPDTAAEKTPPSDNTPREANPYMVPRGIDLVLHTDIKKAFVGDQIASELGGSLYVKDGTLILEEMGFICDAAKMQLSATYKTPRKNHLYLGFIYHMVDIKIDELIGMFPVVGEMIPMLTAFKGNAEFHVAAETYTDAYYNIKPSTLRGACSIQGNDLVLLDGDTFSKISKLLLFSKKTENRIDSLFAEMSLYKDEIDVYPLLITMDKYQAALGGHHYLDMNFDYHISLLRPLRLGVDVKGNMDDLKIRLAKSRYAEDFKQKKEHAVETQSQRMRKIIRESLEQTVKIE